jgi:hypothetical protein
MPLLTRTRTHIDLQAFEDTLDGWMSEFHTFLTYDNPLAAAADEDSEGELDALKATVRSAACLPACQPASQMRRPVPHLRPSPHLFRPRALPSCPCAPPPPPPPLRCRCAVA